MGFCCKIPGVCKLLFSNGLRFKNNKLDKDQVFVVKSPACVSFC